MLLEREIKKYALIWRDKRLRLIENKQNIGKLVPEKPVMIDIDGKRFNSVVVSSKGDEYTVKLADGREFQVPLYDIILAAAKRSSPDDTIDTEQIEKEIISGEKERATAGDRGNYKRPTSFKCSLSMAMNVGTWRKKEVEHNPRIIKHK